MSAVEPAIEALLTDEGGYSNDPRDPGGETKYGISRRWAVSVGLPDLDIKNLTPKQVSELYHRYWWNEYRYGEIEDQDLANELLSMSVLAGPGPAHVCLQRAVLAVLRDPDAIRVDGILGPITRRTVNSLRTCCLSAAFRSEQAGYLRSLHSRAFERGWERRAYR